MTKIPSIELTNPILLLELPVVIVVVVVGFFFFFSFFYTLFGWIKLLNYNTVRLCNSMT